MDKTYQTLQVSGALIIVIKGLLKQCFDNFFCHVKFSSYDLIVTGKQEVFLAMPGGHYHDNQQHDPSRPISYFK